MKKSSESAWIVEKTGEDPGGGKEGRIGKGRKGGPGVKKRGSAYKKKTCFWGKRGTGRCDGDRKFGAKGGPSPWRGRV